MALIHSPVEKSATMQTNNAILLQFEFKNKKQLNVPSLYERLIDKNNGKRDQ